MNVPEPSERTFDLLIDKKVRELHLGDATRHLQLDAEVPSSPSDFLAHGDEPDVLPPTASSRNFAI